MSTAPGDGDDLEAIAQEELGEVSEDIGHPVCPTCHRPMDDVATLPMNKVMEAINEELARDILRTLRDGTATHQEKAIARGLLRDKGVLSPEEDGPGPGGRHGGARPQARVDHPKHLDDRDYSDTDGG